MRSMFSHASSLTAAPVRKVLGSIARPQLEPVAVKRAVPIDDNAFVIVGCVPERDERAPHATVYWYPPLLLDTVIAVPQLNARSIVPLVPVDDDAVIQCPGHPEEATFPTCTV